jgi:elongation factor Ts
MAQIACETDFAARSALFLATGGKIVDRAFERQSSVPDAEIGNLVTDLGRVVKEKVVLERLAFVECGTGERLSLYLHADGAIGVLLRWRADGVAWTGSALPAAPSATGPADNRVEAFFHDVALHVAAFAPAFLDESSVPAEYLREKVEAFRVEIEADPRASTKPAAMREAIAAGKLRKHLALVCLLSQGFVRDEKVPVAATLRRLGDETGFALALLGFDRFEVGRT